MKLAFDHNLCLKNIFLVKREGVKKEIEIANMDNKMAVTTYQMLQSKDTGQMDKKTRPMHTYAVYKRPTSDQMTLTD